LLLDEPFGALDAHLRREMQDPASLWTGSGRTVAFVTHDIDEALIPSTGWCSSARSAASSRT
jgi:NitT/TauT family transport system ATP-binding protein